MARALMGVGLSLHALAMKIHRAHAGHLVCIPIAQLGRFRPWPVAYLDLKLTDPLGIRLASRAIL
jgi:hypothetical protein